MSIKNQFIYYDFNNLQYSSYFLTGFYQNSDTYHYDLTVSKKIPQILTDKQSDNKYNEILPSICLFKARLPHDEFFFCIDARDSYEANLNRGNGYHLPLLDKVKYYFKVNYNSDAIISDPNLRRYKAKIFPSLPFFPIKVPRVLPFIPRVIPCKALSWKIRDSIWRIKTLKSALPLEKILRMRSYAKELDIFFVTTFYDQDVHSENNEFRYQIMKEIKNHPKIKSLVGFISHKKTSFSKYSDLQVPPYPLKEYLTQIAKSRIAIYIRGLHNCLSFKFGYLLSMGMPIVGQTIFNNKANILSYRYFKEQFAYDDPKAIVAAAFKLLENPEKQEILSISNSNVFDTSFSPKAVVSNILKHLNLEENKIL